MEKGWEDTIVFTVDLGGTPSPTKSEREAMNAVGNVDPLACLLAAVRPCWRRRTSIIFYPAKSKQARRVARIRVS